MPAASKKPSAVKPVAKTTPKLAPSAPKMRGKTIKKSKAPAAVRNPKLLANKSSRPSTKEARLKRLGKFVGDKKDSKPQKGGKPSSKRVGTPTFKKKK